MPITYPLALPAVSAPRSVTLEPLTVVAHQVSPFTLQGQAQVHQGMRWQGRIELPPMRRADAETWLAWLLALNGQEGTFLLGAADIHSDYALLGSGAGAPAVDGAGQTGRTLNSKGWTPSAAGVLRAGDYIGLGSGASARLYKVLQDVNADGAGKAAISIWPRLRESPADGANIETAAPKLVCRLAANQAAWTIDAMRVLQTGFTFQEAL